MKDIINQQYRGKIQLDICGEGNNTLSLFEKAKRRVSENPNVYKHVWVIYDTDDFPADHINRTAELCEMNTTADTQYHAVWSNQCIELWFLLHFSFFHSDIHRKEYWPKLSDWLVSMEIQMLGNWQVTYWLKKYRDSVSLGRYLLPHQTDDFATLYYLFPHFI